MHFEKDKSLQGLNTFGIDVYAKYFAGFKTIDELANTFNEKSNHASDITNHTLILGGGSNMLFTSNIDGCVLKNEITGIEKTGEDDDSFYIKAGAGENWHQFVIYCLEHNYAGVENLALIPGNVGASPMQNIGAYGVEIKDVFQSLEAFDLEEKKMVIFQKADCNFGYRESIFKNKFKGRFIITSVTYRLLKKPVFNTSYGAIESELNEMKITEVTIQSIAQAVMNIRRSKLPDPAVIGNAGSFFKNPEIPVQQFEDLQTRFPAIVGYKVPNGSIKVAAGSLIEQCGWKGYRKGDAGCHAKQALVLVNYGNATGEEIFNLSNEIIQSVQTKFSITLEREVNIINHKS